MNEETEPDYDAMPSWTITRVRTVVDRTIVRARDHAEATTIIGAVQDQVAWLVSDAETDLVAMWPHRSADAELQEGRRSDWVEVGLAAGTIRVTPRVKSAGAEGGPAPTSFVGQLAALPCDRCGAPATTRTPIPGKLGVAPRCTGCIAQAAAEQESGGRTFGNIIGEAIARTLAGPGVHETAVLDEHGGDECGELGGEG